MRNKFSLFQSHLDLAHSLWKNIVLSGDFVIDATCGNGHDTLFLSQLALTDDSGTVFAIDIQQPAIDATKQLLNENLSKSHFERVRFFNNCHSSFPEEIKELSVKLIVYNLGYLPGGNKSFTTCIATTLQSLQKGMSLLKNGGAISITCYPGHAEGKNEENKLVDFIRELNPEQWQCTFQQWLNRKSSPSLILIQKGSFA